MKRHLRLAFLTDIHGNLPALEAALHDIDRQTPDAVFLLGDLVNRCPWTVEVLDLLRERGWPSVQGNHDLVLSLLNTSEIWPPFDERQRFPLIYWTWEHLRAQDICHLRNLPHDLLVEFEGAPCIRLFHGMPGNPFIGIYPGLDAQKVAQAITIYDEPVLICGHTHRPLDRTFTKAESVSAASAETMRPCEQRVLNPGSVGMPYNGDPRVQYMLLDLVQKNGQTTWQPRFRQLPYDLSLVEQAFHERGMLAESGPIAKLSLRTIKDAQPWVSDFGQWLRGQPLELRRDPSSAVELYLQTHGPHQWAFTG